MRPPAAIDAHQHFWRYRPEMYSWMSDDMDVLKRDYLPRDLRPHLDAAGISASIAVQARASEQETDFLLDLGAENDWIVGVVGWMDLRTEDPSACLDRWQHNPRLVGFRHQLQDEADVSGFIRDSRFQRNLARLQRAGKTYDVLVFEHQLDAAIELCHRLDGHYLILDHLGKPPIGRGQFEDWYRRLQSFRPLPHVACKLSGLVTEAAQANGQFDRDQIRRYLDAALETFGATRLLYGSDWPVCLLAAPYEAVHDLLRTWASALSESERAQIFGVATRRCYGITSCV